MPPVRVTVKVIRLVPESPSVTVTSLMVTSGGGPSSLTMVPVAVASEMVAPTLGLVRVTVKFSSPSGPMSPSTLNVTVAVVSPLAKLTWPESGESAVKSSVFASNGPLPKLTA